MPLTVFNRAAGARAASVALAMPSELERADVILPPTERALFAARAARLQPVFSHPVFWTKRDPGFDTFKRELAGFLNAQMSGPFFVEEAGESNAAHLEVTLLKPTDVKKFAGAFPGWSQKKDAADKNLDTLRAWRNERPLFDSQSFTHRRLFACIPD